MKKSDITIKIAMKKLFSVMCLMFVWQIQTNAEVEASCYFPHEFQGEYVMQSPTISSTVVQYSTLNITTNSIPIWGNCHRRIGNNFILMINYGENSCIRCLHLKLRSGSVLQVLASSQETVSKCYINKESAEENCPTEESLLSRSAAEIILFKTKDIDGGYTRKEYCPIDGKYYVNYALNDDENKEECSGEDSVLDSCPSGSTLNLRLHSCTSKKYDIKFDCLAYWEGSNNQTYLALLDHRKNNKNQPQYRCALYKRDPITGIIHLALSKDSTCSTDLINASYGYETLVLTPKRESAWPPDVTYSSCSFPKWMQGNWEHIKVDDNTLVYKDHTSFKTYTIKCVASILDSETKYLVFSRTQCDEEQYNCMYIVKRSDNIMEFELGTNFSTTRTLNELCADNNFEDGSWTTQGRLEDNIPKPIGMCPISGEYTGLIPDTTDLCAKLWSDYRAPELMYYQVSECETKEILEEREYKCLGHWKEGELLYTYTQRRDVAPGTYECFVGSIITNKEIYIKEAGEHCQRSIDPLKYGMKLIKKVTTSLDGQISTIRYETNFSKIQTVISTTTTIRSTTKPWNLGIPYPTIPADIDNSINKSSIIYYNVCSMLTLIVILKYF